MTGNSDNPILTTSNNKGPVFDRINHLTQQLVEMYKNTDSLSDKQYIFSGFKDLLYLCRGKQLADIEKIIYNAMVEITSIKR